MSSSETKKLPEIPETIDLFKIFESVAKKLQRPIKNIKTSLDLLKEGNTVPFIARYRKELTNNLDETQLRDIQKTYNSLYGIEERKITVLNSIAKQDKLTNEIMQKIISVSTLQEVEDIYLPFKPKIKTLGAKAREQGLEPLADIVRSGKIPIEFKGTIDDNDLNLNLEDIALKFLNTEKGIENAKQAISGANDIIAEDIGSNPDLRKIVREIVFKRNFIKTEDKKGIFSNENPPKNADGKPIDPHIFENYFNFSHEGARLQNHQILAINRADKWGIINLAIDTPDEDMIQNIKKKLLLSKSEKTNQSKNNPFIPYYEKGIEAGFKRYIIKAIKREYWNSLKKRAETRAIMIFADNLKNLLMTHPLKNRGIIGIDPGFRTGCKVAAIDAHGNFLDNSVIYPHEPKKKWDEAKTILWDMAQKHKCYTFSIGNGTASRETEQLVGELIKDHKNSEKPLEYTIVSEAGASIYSASKTAIEEFPNLDLTVRGAISIARRIQDPLSELIKIDPKSIGVGMYQHDVNQKELKEELDAVIEDCVNGVGVDLNTASKILLEHVSGITKNVAKKIMDYRKEHKVFKNRKELLKVRGLGPKAFEQCAGFLKIRGGSEPLDATFVHPESYHLTEQILSELNIKIENLINKETRTQASEQLLSVKPKSYSQKFKVTPERIKFLVEQLRKPDLDPRDECTPPILRKDVLSIEDLKEGMIVKGTVRNVVDFGAFVDIGIKYNGLIHKSEIADQYVKDPRAFLKIGDAFDLMITSIDIARHRIQLSLKRVPEKNLKKK